MISISTILASHLLMMCILILLRLILMVSFQTCLGSKISRQSQMRLMRLSLYGDSCSLDFRMKKIFWLLLMILFYKLFEFFYFINLIDLIIEMNDKNIKNFIELIDEANKIIYQSSIML